MMWHPVIFASDSDRVGRSHDYRSDRPGCLWTACGLPLAPDHGVVSADSSKPWCGDCFSITEERAQKERSTMTDDHDHVFGPLELSRFAGTVHRKCTVSGCKEVLIEFNDDDDDDDDVETHR